MKNSKVLAVINELIDDEGGRPVTLNGQLADSQLDDLALIVFAVALDETFIGVLTHVDPDMSIRELVHKCRLLPE